MGYFKMFSALVGVIVLSRLFGKMVEAKTVILPAETWFVPVSVLIVCFVFVFVLPMDLFETSEQ